MGVVRVVLFLTVFTTFMVQQGHAFGCGARLLWRGPSAAKAVIGNSCNSPGLVGGRGATGGRGELIGPTMGLGAMIMMQMRDPLDPEEDAVASDKMSNVDLLEAQLSNALDKEDYGEAAKLRDRLIQMRMDNTLGVLEGNSRFYRAFAKGDYRAMDDVWQDDNDFVSCAHPGMPLASGRDSVMSSWRDILANPPDIRIETPKVVMYGPNTACVTCEEHLLSGSNASMGPTAVGLATNIFVKSEQDGVWRIAHHHAGPIIPKKMRIEHNA